MSTPTTSLRYRPLLPPSMPAAQALDADAWAAVTFRSLFPCGSIPTRQAINRALAAAVPRLASRSSFTGAVAGPGSTRAALSLAAAVPASQSTTASTGAS